MVGFQLPTTCDNVGAWPMEVTRRGALVGRIVPDPSGRVFRYFPGAHNDVAFVFEHPNLGALLHLIDSRSWEAELQRLQRSPDAVDRIADEHRWMRKERDCVFRENAGC